MSEENKKRVIMLGAPPGTFGLSAVIDRLRERRPDLDIVVTSDEREMVDLSKVVVVDDNVVQFKDMLQMLGRSIHRNEFSAQASMREFYADRRYQEPTRLRGAAAHKRQAKKMKNKSRSKRK